MVSSKSNIQVFSACRVFKQNLEIKTAMWIYTSFLEHGEEVMVNAVRSLTNFSNNKRFSGPLSNQSSKHDSKYCHTTILKKNFSLVSSYLKDKSYNTMDFASLNEKPFY